MSALSLKGEMYSFSPRRTLAHILMVPSGSQERNLASRTVRRARRIQVPLKTVSPASSTTLDRAEI